VQKPFWGGKIVCAHQVFLCALVSRPVCVRTSAQLRGNIANYVLLFLLYITVF